MMTRIQDLTDIQCAFIRSLLSRDLTAPLLGAVTPEMVVEAHARFLVGRPGAPVPHESTFAVVMFVVHGKWKGICPECSSGVTTFAGYPRAHCFECGAILAATWPADREGIEADLLTRIPTHRHWHPDQEDDHALASD
jgi:hypothetical protein